MIKERPILMCAEMVRATLEGRKTQTRRCVKPQPILDRRMIKGPRGTEYGKEIGSEYHESWKWNGHHTDADALCKLIETKGCPHGQPGDRLWVREAWRAVTVYDEFAPSTFDSGASVLWVADGAKRLNGPDDFGRLRPSIHMPRWASRITLEIVSVRVEQVQDISPNDAKAEGVQPDCRRDHVTHDIACYIEAFERLWDSLNAKRGFSWASNPWVWRVEFKRITK